jgi:ribosome biogenesis protein YTM1
MADVDSTAVAGDRTVALSFFTRHPYPREQMPVTTFAVPITTLLEGLNALVNDVLFADAGANKPDQPIPFDFVINDEYLPNATALDTFLRRQRRRLGLGADTMEQVIQVEYLPAFQAQEGSKLPHDDWISCVRAPLPGNAEFLVTAAYDHAVRVWAGDTCLAVGTGHVEAVKSIAIVPGSVVPYKAESAAAGKKTGKRRGREDDANEQASFDMVSVSKDGTVRAWHYDAAARKLNPLVATVDALGATIHSDGIDTVDVDSTGRFIATGSWDTTCAILDYSKLVNGTTARPLYSFADHARAVLAVRFSPQNPSLLYSTGLDGSIKMWDTEAGLMKGTLKGCDHAAQGMSIRPPGGNSASSADLILSGHTDNRIRLYDPRASGNNSVVKVWAGHRQWVYSVAWLWRREEDNAAMQPSTSTTLLASASEDATLKIWDLRSTSSALLTLDSLHTDGILDVTYAGGMKLACGGKDNRTKSVTVEQP